MRPLSLGSVLAAGLTVTALSVAASPAQAVPPVPHFSTSRLDSDKLTLDERLARPPAGVTGWGVDPGTGRVTVSVLASDAHALAVAKASIGGLPSATITTVTERPRPFADLIGGQSITTSGSQCSLGFSALAADRSVAYVLTAGHCTTIGGSWAGPSGTAIGSVASSSFPSDDFGAIRVESTNTWRPTAQVLGSTSRTVLKVVGSTEAAVGASVCRVGVTTGYHCGTVQAKNQSVNYDGRVVRGLTKTSACAEPGDSGGPFFTPATSGGVQAQGLTSGGSGTCSSGGTTYFQPIGEALTRYGVTLVTTTTTPLPSRPDVGLCSDANSRGACIVTNTDQPDMATNAVGNDKLSSIIVPAGTWLSLYPDNNYLGACQAFSADRAFLGGTRIGNDQVSSYKITTSQPAGCPTT